MASGPAGRWMVVDTHVDSLLGVVRQRRSLDERVGQWNWPEAQQAGVRLQVLACWVEPVYKPMQYWERLTALLWAFWDEVEAHPEVIPVRTARDLAQVEAGGGGGWLLAVEGLGGFAASLTGLRGLYRLGVRMASLTWNERNELADGAAEDPGGGGLSRAGRAYLAEMERLGVVVDLAHLAEAGFWDVLNLAHYAPVVSHANCWTLAPHRRNLRDRQIRALAARGGVQGITLVPEFLGGRADLDRVVDHIEHALEVVGDDRHLGLGTDFDGVEQPVEGVETVAQLPRLAERMSARGLADDTIARVMGENFWHYFQQALARDQTVAHHL